MPECSTRAIRYSCGARGGGLLLWLLLLTFSTNDAQGKSYALLIGIGDFEQWHDLDSPVADVRAVAEELRHYGFLAEVLEDPKEAEVLQALRRYALIDYGPEDQLLVFFAGHGNYDEVTGIGYLAARDSATRQRDPNFATLINYPWLLALLDQLSCRRILLVVDACYSGSLATGGRGAAGRRSAAPKSRRFLTSGGKEYVPDGRAGHHTPFVTQLLAGLRSPGVGGSLSLDQLQRFMARVDPKPRWGAFGSDSGQAGLVFAGRRKTAASPGSTARAQAPPVAAVRGSIEQAPPAAPQGHRLRHKGAALTVAQLRRIFVHHGLYDPSLNPEGDAPNELRPQQTADLWKVVLDIQSGLMWQQGGSDRRLTYKEAAAYVNGLNSERHGGFADWRLPTLEELATLLEPERQAGGLHIDPLFDSTQQTCWTNDRAREDGSHYYISFNVGQVVLHYGDRKIFVRAVRHP